MHVWAQKSNTYFKTVCVGWVLCVISVQIAYRDTSHIVGDHRVPEVLFRGSSQQQQRDRLISGPGCRNAGRLQPEHRGHHKEGKRWSK